MSCKSFQVKLRYINILILFFFSLKDPNLKNLHEGLLSYFEVIEKGKLNHQMNILTYSVSSREDILFFLTFCTGFSVPHEFVIF